MADDVLEPVDVVDDVADTVAADVELEVAVPEEVAEGGGSEVACNRLQ